jgi:hypothetical protein
VAERRLSNMRHGKGKQRIIHRLVEKWLFTVRGKSFRLTRVADGERYSPAPQVTCKEIGKA